MSIIKSKRRRPESLGYNSWMTIPFGIGAYAYASGLSVSSTYPASLGLNTKFTHLTYTVQGTSPEGISGVLNIISGAVASGPVTNTSYGYFDFGGTFAANDVVTVTVDSEVYKFVVSARSAGNNTALASNLTTYLNNNTAFASRWIANSLGVEVVIQPNIYNAVTYTYSVTLQSASGTVTAGGSTMVAGTGTQAAYPSPIPDQTQVGVIPSAVAPNGAALFPVDIIIPTFTAQATGKTGSIYATKNFDCIWGANSSITLTTANNGPISGVALTAQLYGVPVDNHPMQPQEANAGFHLSPNVL